MPARDHAQKVTFDHNVIFCVLLHEICEICTKLCTTLLKF